MAEVLTWGDLTKEERKRLEELGLVRFTQVGAAYKRPGEDDTRDFTAARALLNDPEFLGQTGDLKGKELSGAFKQWQLETPLRQQERVGKASIDLGLENTPEVIAGGTASTQRKSTPRVAASTSSSLATALGVGAAIGNLSTSLGVR